MKFKIGIAAGVLAASALCGAAVSAGQIDYVNIDDAIVYTAASSSFSQENGGAVKCNLYAGDSLGTITSDSFSFSAPRYSFYKSHLVTNTPSSFESSGKQLITVFEVKFKAELLDAGVEYKPKINYGLRYARADSAGFIENQQESSHIDADGEWITLKYEFSAVTGKVNLYKNGELIRELTDANLTTSDIGEIRFYPRTIPEKNGDGKYPNGKTTLNFGDDDAAVECCTPVIWTFDYVKIYQITPFEIASSQPADGEENVSISGPYRVSFDTDMNGATLSPATVQMELEYDNTSMPAVAYLTSNDTCEVTPIGMLEYYSRYRLAFLKGVTDVNGFTGDGKKYVSFTTGKREITENVSAAAVDIKIDGESVTALSDGVLSGAYTVNSETEQDIVISSALYKKNGSENVCIERAEQAVTLKSGENTLEIPAVAVSESSGSFVKIMVWRADGYPLTDVVLCDAGGIRED